LSTNEANGFPRLYR